MKIFRSTNQVKKHYFPISYKKEMEEKVIEKLGIGLWFARRFLADVRGALKKMPKEDDDE